MTADDWFRASKARQREVWESEARERWESEVMEKLERVVRDRLEHKVREMRREAYRKGYADAQAGKSEQPPGNDGGRPS